MAVNGDRREEADETFTVVLSNPIGTNVSIGDGTGVGTILDDDIEADLSVGVTDSPDPVVVGAP